MNPSPLKINSSEIKFIKLFRELICSKGISLVYWMGFKQIISLRGFFIWRFPPVIQFDSEKSMNNFFFENLNNKNVKFVEEFGLANDIKFYQEFDIHPYGIIDTLAIEHCSYFYKGDNICDIYITIFEYKNTPLNEKGLHQLTRYMEGFKELFYRKNIDAKIRTFNINGLFIGPSIAVGDWVYTSNVLDNLNIYTFSLDPSEGINFKRCEDWGKSAKMNNKSHENFDSIASGISLSLSKLLKDSYFNEDKPLIAWEAK